MKFAIVLFLGLCAIVAHATLDIPEFQVTDPIREKVEGFIRSATDKLTAVIHRVKEIIQDIEDQAAVLVMKAEEKANEMKSEIQHRLNQIKQKGGKTAECAENLEPEYREIEQKLKDELRSCAGGVYKASEEMRQNIHQGISEIKNKIADLRNMVSNCVSWNPIETVECIRGKMDDLKNALAETLTFCGQAVSNAEYKSIQIMNTAHECNAFAISKATKSIEQLNKRLAQC